MDKTKGTEYYKIVHEAAIKAVKETLQVDDEVADAICDTANLLSADASILLYSSLNDPSKINFTVLELHRAIGKVLIAIADTVEELKKRTDWEEIKAESEKAYREGMAELARSVQAIQKPIPVSIVPSNGLPN